jgi:single-strand DNA-binding protein
MNTVIIRGNMVRDPELRSVGSNDRSTSVVNFTIATSREYTKADGTRDKITSFLNCEAWDSGAESISNSLKKGDLVFVEGSLRNDSWEKDGVKHSTLKVRVNNFAKITRTSSKKPKSKDQQEESLAAF